MISVEKVKTEKFEMVILRIGADQWYLTPEEARKLSKDLLKAAK